MNNDFLSRLYWACTDQENPLSEGLNLGELYHRTKDTDKVSHYFGEKLYLTSLPTEEKTILDNINGSVAMAYEQQGFINGFRIGMKLAVELWGEEKANWTR